MVVKPFDETFVVLDVEGDLIRGNEAVLSRFLSVQLNSFRPFLVKVGGKGLPSWWIFLGKVGGDQVDVVMGRTVAVG